MISTLITYLYQNLVLFASMVDASLVGVGAWKFVILVYVCGLPIAGLYNAYRVPRSIRRMDDDDNNRISLVSMTIFTRLFIGTIAWVIILPICTVVKCIRLTMSFSLRSSMYIRKVVKDPIDNVPAGFKSDPVDECSNPYRKGTAYKIINSAYPAYRYSLTRSNIIKINSNAISRFVIILPERIERSDSLVVHNQYREIPSKHNWVFMKPNTISFDSRSLKEMSEGDGICISVPHEPSVR